MSRIHEALQRAYLERGKATALDEVQVAEPVETFPRAVEAPAPPVRVELAADKIAQHAWSPNLLAFPTLLERGAAVEQFRSLRSQIYQARYETPLKTVLIASGMPAEGKSFVAANLAMSLARNSIHNILLIDGDLRRPTLHSLLGAPNLKGLSNYLEGTAELDEIMQRNSVHSSAESKSDQNISNLTFIPSGKCSGNSSELLANHRMEDLVAAVSPHFDWIVIDAPPVLAVTDSIELSRAADAVLLVARAASTPFEVAERAKAAFGTARILGFVLNDIKRAPRSGSYNYNYNYYYGDQAAVDDSIGERASGK